MIPEQMLELEGTPDQIQAWLNVASRVEPAIYRKHRVHPGLVRLWYRSTNHPNDLVRAIKMRADPKPKEKAKGKAWSKRFDVDETLEGSLSVETESGDGASTGQPEA